ncbi:MAG: hypothetical protein J5817_01255, partial [Treponema sp.]|nr:hypothetical protein [Treponema sp.]
MTKPSFDLIIQIADKLGVKPDSLFFTSEDFSFKQEISDKLSKEQLKRIKNVFSSAMDVAMEELKK